MAGRTRTAIVVDDVKAKALLVLRQHGVEQAGLFGSVVREDLAAESDIDLLVQMPKRATLPALSGLEIDLAQALGRQVD